MDIIHSQIPQIQASLLNWYARHQRDLPWRHHKNPYYTLVSEIMLQQTKVVTVIPYFERFIKRFPTINDLANASDDEVVKMWEGLGYYSRARNLHAAVKEVIANYGGKIPSEKTEISKLKGVGPYTTGAVLSIAYNQKVPAVDGNVMRVFARLFALDDDIAKTATRKKMEYIAEEVIPVDAPGDFNQALMELGATICMPRSPECLFCPVGSYCKAYEQGRERDLPIKTKARSPKVIPIIMLTVTYKDQILIQKRPDKGLLANMWSLPTEERREEIPLLQQVEEYCQLNKFIAEVHENTYQFEHVFSHLHWKIILVAVTLSRQPKVLPSRSIWTDQREIADFAFPNVYIKALEQIGYRK
jgi:A/G-specific adenine glycosylase